MRAMSTPSTLARSGLRLRPSWPMLLGAAAFLCALAAGAVRIDPDAYWHIVTGRWILAHGYVPTHDLFSFTMRGAPWIAQEWSGEVLIAAAFALAKWQGLVLLTAALFALSVAYLARFLLVRMEPMHAVVLTVLAACMMFTYIIVRPYEIAWPIAALWTGALVDHCERQCGPPWWLLGVMLLWANLHGSFILGLGLATVIGAEAIAGAKVQWRPACMQWGGFIAVAFGCAMLNPQGFELLIYPFHLLAMHALGQLTEWQQPSFQHLQVLGLWMIVMLLLAFAGRIRLPFLRSVLLVGLIYIALQHVRNVSLLGLLAPFLVARPIANLWKEQSARLTDESALDRVFSALAGRGNMVALGATIVLSGVIGISIVRIGEPKPPAQFTPRVALNFLISRQPNARILDDYNFGGYLIFRGIPVFVDGRADMYGDRFCQRYFSVVRLAENGNVDALLDKYRINAILMSPQWPVVRLLDRMSNWKRVYADNVAVVFVRNIARP